MYRPDNWGKVKPKAEEVVGVAKTMEGVAYLNGFTRGIEDGADAMLEALIKEVRKHPVFWKNCKAQKEKPAKICIDCPLRMAGVIPEE
jgi:hypothetical protein